MPDETTDTGSRRAVVIAVLCVCYVLAVYAMDSLAQFRVHFVIDWSVFLWRGPHDFDIFKFVAWLVVPLLLSVTRLDIDYFTDKRWQRTDGYILVGLLVAGLAVASLVKVIPNFDAFYQSLHDANTDRKVSESLDRFIWICSWVVGWEFTHRYFLLVRLKAAWPRWAWLAIPFLEVIYHYMQHKHILELVMVAVGGVILTYWALKRENTLLPLIFHSFLEIGFFAYLIWL